MHPELCFPLSFQMTNILHSTGGTKASYQIVDANGRKIGQLANVSRPDFDVIQFYLSDPELVSAGFATLLARGWTETTSPAEPAP